MTAAAAVAPEVPAGSPRVAWDRAGAVWLVLLTIALRLAVASVGYGTTDVLFWMDWGQHAATEPFYELWSRYEFMNHPPLTVLYADAVYRLVGWNWMKFSYLIKLPSLLGDVIAVSLILDIVGRRTCSVRAGRWAGLLFAVNPVSLLLTGYQGNHDPLVGGLSLLVWWLAERGQLLGAALALGASINTKLSPCPTVLILFACCRNRDDVCRVLLGLFAWAIPMAWMYGWIGQTFLDQTVGYRPGIENWIAFAAQQAQRIPALFVAGWQVHDLVVSQQAKVLLLMATVVALMRWRKDERFSALDCGTIYWCLACGFSLRAWQYGAWPTALLAAVRPRWAAAYGVIGGAWLLCAYWTLAIDVFPFKSLIYPGWDEWCWPLNAAAGLILFAAATSIARSPTPTLATGTTRA